MRKSERGANLAEAALVLPLLALLLAGVIDLGRAFQTWIVITNAARDGARTGARISCYASDATQRSNLRTAILTATKNAAANNGFTVNDADITIVPDPVATGCQSAGLPVRVTVRHDVTTFMGNFVGTNTYQMSARAAMSKIGDPVP
jgi:Flp pilus assembly protein TadG